MGKRYFPYERVAPYPRIIPREQWGDVLHNYWIELSLQVVVDKWGVTRERIRQIIEKQGQNPTEIKNAIKDYKYFYEVQAKYRTCSRCKRHYSKNMWRRLEESKKRSDLCRLCINRIRYKLNNYKYQKIWIKRNPEKYRAAQRRTSKAWQKKHPIKMRNFRKKYYYQHRERYLARQREYWKKRRLQDPEWFWEWRHQYQIKRNLLNPKDAL